MYSPQSSMVDINSENDNKITSSKRTRARYSRDDLAPFNLLSQPVWVFDIECKAMWWANNSALELWNAETLESLLERDFAEDMSDATARTLDEYLLTFQKGGSLTARWTYYPKGKGPTTVDVQLSGMYEPGGRLLMLNEGHIVPKDEIDQASLRGVEMLKHLPVSICQFDVDGTLMHQNPEALEVFGNPPENRKRRAGTTSVGTPDGSSTTTSSLSSPLSPNDAGINSSCHFRSRFLDQELAQRIFDEVVHGGKDHCMDAQQYTKQGIRWGSVKVRRARDPVTGNPSVLYSFRDITDVIQAKKEADEANARKSEFIAVMAHEIRTPLHQVIGTIDLLGQTELNKEQNGFVKLLQSGALLLMAVINDLLDYTKLEAGKMELECIPFDARAVVDGCVAAVAPRADEKGIKLEAYFEPPCAFDLVGDPNRLRQIVLNLLSNAVKFTHKGTVTARVKTIVHAKGQSVVRFQIEDTGIGIGTDFQKQIFGKYRQADPKISSTYGGTGLGLAICERLVNMMGGRIGMDSELGKGSVFWFELKFDGTKKHVLQESQCVDTSADVVGLSILVAEDNKVNQKVVCAMLRRLGHSATVVENGKLALDMSKSKEFDMILMDIQMPVMDGIEATKQIRSEGISCPVIGLTASFQSSELPFYQKAGMTDCISKPVRLDGLRRAIYENQINYVAANRREQSV